jgi:hypothetical protein
MFQLAADYERKANLAETLETSLRTPYDQDGPIPEVFEAFLTPSNACSQKYRVKGTNLDPGTQT